jgi:hypothetical protein
LQAYVEDINSHREILQEIDMTGTYLKYFGNKQDTLYVKAQLQSIKLRFKKLKRRAERGRLLNQAHREDVRVGLCFNDEYIVLALPFDWQNHAYMNNIGIFPI